MKFGAELKAQMLSGWRFYYLDYNDLKHRLKQGTEIDNQFTDKDEGEFIDLLDKELEKVCSFHSLKKGEIQRRIQHCEFLITSSSSPSSSSYGVTPSSLTTFIEIEEEINRITVEVQELARYTRVNYTGFIKLVKKHDKHTKYILQPAFMDRLNANPFFRDVNFEGLVIKLSRLYDVVRITSQKAADAENPYPRPFPAGMSPVLGLAPPSHRTAKYWIHPDNVMDVKMHILKFLPLTVYKSSRDSASHPATSDVSGKSHKTDPFISSVYLDSPTFELYSTRLENHSRNDMVRLRWYGADDKDIYLEHKIYNSDLPPDESSIKDRFPIKEKKIKPWLREERTANELVNKMLDKDGHLEEEVKEFSRVATETEKIVREKKLTPVLRTMYNRTSFQTPGDASIRISIDSDLVMIREKFAETGEWRRSDLKSGGYGGKQLTLNNGKEDVYKFPFAIMEIKVRQDVEHDESSDEHIAGPRWVTELVSSPLVDPVHNFSKYIHGIAVLYDSKVSGLPFWLPQMAHICKNSPSPYRYKLSSQSSFAFVHDSPNMSSEASITRVDPDDDASYTKSSKSASIDMDISPKAGHSKRDSKYSERTPLMGSERRNVRDEEAAQEINNYEDQIDGKSGCVMLFHFLTCFLFKLGRSGSSSEDRLLPYHTFSLSPYTESRTFLARTERIFFTLYFLCVLLGIFSLGLYNFGDGTAMYIGVILTVITIILMLYALLLYHVRIKILMEKNIGFYEPRSIPIVVCACWLFVVGLNFYLQFSQEVDKDGSTSD